jgi:hypothetical protein
VNDNTAALKANPPIGSAIDSYSSDAKRNGGPQG